MGARSGGHAGPDLPGADRIAVTPDGNTAYAVTSGIFEETVERIDAATLIATPTLIGEAYQGVAAGPNGNVWVSGGPANAVFQYQAVGPALIDLRQAGPAPLTPNRGIPVTGFPGTMPLAGTKLFVAGNLSVPSGTAPGSVPCDRGSLTLFDSRAVPLHDLLAPDDFAIDAAPYTAVLPPTPFLGRGVE